MAPARAVDLYRVGIEVDGHPSFVAPPRWHEEAPWMERLGRPLAPSDRCTRVALVLAGAVVAFAAFGFAGVSIAGSGLVLVVGEVVQSGGLL